MAGGPEDHFTDSRELYVLVEGDEWAHVEALDPDAGYWAPRFAQLVNWRARGERAVIARVQRHTFASAHEYPDREGSPSCWGRADRTAANEPLLARTSESS